jgi:hypothetical protein
MRVLHAHGSNGVGVAGCEWGTVCLQSLEQLSTAASLEAVYGVLSHVVDAVRQHNAE